MEPKQEQFLRMQQYQYAPRMPFYMSYPVQNIYMTEMEYERDMERMKELYPEDAKQIQRLVEEECDRMEYEGSMMFDEYPDRVMLRAICDRIYQNAINPQGMQVPVQIKQKSGTGADSANATEAVEGNDGIERRETIEAIQITDADDTIEGMALEAENMGRQHYRHGPGRPPGHSGPSHNPGLNTLIEVLLYNEMYKRRCRHNRCRRWW